jgi:glutathione S-transferase
LPELYDHVLSDGCYTIRLALKLLGVAHDAKTVDYAPAREPASEAVVALSPSGELPVFVDGALVLSNVATILRHLQATCDSGGTKWPRSAEVERWIDFAMGPLDALSRARRVTLFGAAGDRAALLTAARNALRMLEDHLTDQALIGRVWIAGDAPSLGDVAVFPPVALSHDCGIGHEDYPAINLWQRRVRKLDGFIGMPGIPDYF